jgi:hypothetical protein
MALHIYDDGNTDATSTSAYTGTSGINIVGSADWGTNAGTKTKVSAPKGFTPSIVFKFIKGKFNIIGQRYYEGRIKKLMKLGEKYIALGHNALGDKFLNKVKEEVAYSELAGARITHFIEESLINKIKYRVKGGHIADTDFDKFTRVIPKKVLKRKKDLDGMKVFDKYIIYHYWNAELEEKKEKKESISSSEKSAMKDPILFGIRDDLPGKLFFIADWEDDYCTMTFDDLVDVLDLEEEEVKIPLLKRLFKKKNVKL